jgi:hypothetical protein
MFTLRLHYIYQSGCWNSQKYNLLKQNSSSSILLNESHRTYLHLIQKSMKKEMRPRQRFL